MAGLVVMESTGGRARWAMVAGLLALGCTEPSGQPPSGLPGSGPAPGASPAFVITKPLNPPPSGGGGLVYVSLPPGGTVGGVRADIRNRRLGAPVSVTMNDGGFDPVGVAAVAGDTLLITTSRSDGTAVNSALTVPAFNRPVVVRTNPPPNKRDVPLNASVVVVFSEPVDAASAAQAISLSRQGVPVSGQVVVDTARPWLATFQPAALLAPLSDYRLSIAANVRNLSGVEADSVVVVPFSTGAGLDDQGTDFVLSRTVLTLDIGEQWGLRATSGTVDLVATWTSTDTSVATVTEAGWVRAIRPGTASIHAAVGSVTRSAAVTVRPAPAGMTVSPDSIELIPGWESRVNFTFHDASGADVKFRGEVRVQSSDSAVAFLNPLESNVIDNGSFARLVAGRTGIAKLTLTAAGSGATATVKAVVTPRSGTMTVLALKPDRKSMRLIDVPLDGTRPVGWADASAGTTTADWSPTETLLMDCGGRGLCTVDRQGVTTDLGVAGAVLSPAWHPDGHRIVFTDSALVSWIFDPATRAREAVSVPATRTWGIRIAPAGDAMLFNHTDIDDWYSQVWRWRPGGTPGLVGDRCDSQEWAPVAPALVMVCEWGSGGSAVIVEMAGEQRPLFISYWAWRNEGYPALPRWQPDGTAVGFVTPDAGDPRVLVAKVDGSNVISLSFLSGYQTGMLNGYVPIAVSWRR